MEFDETAWCELEAFEVNDEDGRRPPDAQREIVVGRGAALWRVSIVLGVSGNSHSHDKA